LPRQPGQVLGEGSGRRRVGGVSPQLRPGGRRGRGAGAAKPGGGWCELGLRGHHQLLVVMPGRRRITSATPFARYGGEWKIQEKAMSDEGVRDLVKQKYGQAALRVASGETSCCGSTSQSGCDPVTSNLYATAETADLPREAVAASLGCGNPTALAELKPGETVLDLGSGGGIDVLLSARRVGPTGKAYGLD